MRPGIGVDAAADAGHEAPARRPLTGGHGFDRLGRVGYVGRVAAVGAEPGAMPARALVQSLRNDERAGKLEREEILELGINRILGGQLGKLLGEVGRELDRKSVV